MGLKLRGIVSKTLSYDACRIGAYSKDFGINLSTYILVLAVEIYLSKQIVDNS